MFSVDKMLLKYVNKGVYFTHFRVYFLRFDSVPVVASYCAMTRWQIYVVNADLSNMIHASAVIWSAVFYQRCYHLWFYQDGVCRCYKNRLSMTIFKHVIWSTNRTDQYREMWELWTLGQFSLPLVFLLTHTPYWIVYFSVLTNSWLFYSIYFSTNINSFEKKRWLPKLPQRQEMFPHFTLHWNENVISWWHHQMETFSTLLALCEGNHRPLGDSLAKVSDAELWCFLWSAPEQTIEQTIEMLLSRHRAHYDITVMLVEFSSVAALAVVILTTSSAACDENFISSKWRHFRFSIYWNWSLR